MTRGGEEGRRETGSLIARSIYYGQDTTGVVLYKIENNGGRLVGHWVSANGDGAADAETLTKPPAAAPTSEPGTHLPPAPQKPRGDMRRVVARR